MTAEERESLCDYYCDVCEEWFYIRKLKAPNEITCPYCGDEGDVSISSEGYGKLHGLSRRELS